LLLELLIIKIELLIIHLLRLRKQIRLETMDFIVRSFAASNFTGIAD